MSNETRRTGIYALIILVAILVGASIITSSLGINTAPFVILTGSLIILYALVRGAAAVMVKSTPTHLFVGKPRDPSQIQRVVFDIETREEHIISGTPLQTYRVACRNDWVFHSIDPNGSWMIQDERGNDISELPLSEYHGIAQLVSLQPGSVSKPYYDEYEDASDEYSDIDHGVTFYD